MHSYKKTDNKRKLSHDIHIWIGSESTQDEYGTAAYKMVELDEHLERVAVQHREVESKESTLFLSYFKNKVTYLNGGIDAGFSHVEPTEADPHLYRIKGTMKNKTLRMTQVQVRRDSLNCGDVFILVCGTERVWMWVGESANQDEKSKGMEIAREFCTKGNVVVLEQGESTRSEW